MPFCTACGRKNPDDARFCSQCGTRLVTADTDQPTEPSGEGPGESTATISVQAGAMGTSGTGESSRVETSDRQLNAVDAAAVDALPPGHALLVVQKGPGSGSRFLLDADVVTAGGTGSGASLVAGGGTVGVLDIRVPTAPPPGSASATTAWRPRAHMNSA